MRTIVSSFLLAVTLGAAASAQEVSLKPVQMCDRQQGDLRDDGSFSFWDNGVLGDRFIAEGNRVTLTVVASGRSVAGEPPRLAVETARVDGQPREVARLEIHDGKPRPYSVEMPVPTGYCTIRLRHLNRSVAGAPKEFRHLLVTSVGVKGAKRAACGPTRWLLFRDLPAAGPPEAGTRTLETAHLRATVDAENGVWTLAIPTGEIRLDAIRPMLVLDSKPVALRDGRLTERSVDHPLLGPCREIELRFRPPENVAAVYRLTAARQRPELLVQFDFENSSGHAVEVNRAAPLAVGRLALAGPASGWNALGDGKSNDQPCRLLAAAEAREFDCWWYLGLKHAASGRSLLLGSLTNNKGLGRFFLDGQGETLQTAAWHDYEAIVMPPGAHVTGEPVLVHFGRCGTDSLDRFGTLVAAAHGIDLPRQHPLDPDDPARVGLFNTWNSYGAGVIRGFHYRHDAAKYEKPFMDPQWTNANWQKIRQLGLDAFGYGGPPRNLTAPAPAPLARRYGQPDFWGKDLRQIAQEHPEFYVDGRIDFSHPGVLDLERGRVARAFQDPGKLVTYAWDFTNFWSRLPGQHDPFRTSAETYRAAMGVWREQALRHPAGAYGLLWMNVVGLNYDRCDVIHIGHDSDQAYYGRGCTVTEGLVRQISGRWFYNGRVWWNSADSFHVYAGGIYSRPQAKVHASFCAMAGNLIHLAEPLSDQDTPDDRLEIIRRVAPTTAEVAQAVDVFEHLPARLWNMPVRRPFAVWNIVGLFNFDEDQRATPVTQEVRMADLGLSPEREYLVYEFWSQSLVGVVRGSFTRTLQAPDCEIYAIVEKADHPQLVSTSRHVRQMAYDVRDVKWDAESCTLRGVSRVVRGDRYQLRIHVPAGFALASADVPGQAATTRESSPLALVEFTSPESRDVSWAVRFETGR
jgi:hypothetical protein